MTSLYFSPPKALSPARRRREASVNGPSIAVEAAGLVERAGGLSGGTQSTPAIDLQVAMEHYKKASGRMFPTWCEILEVLKALGYEKPDAKITGASDRGGHPELDQADYTVKPNISKWG